MEDLLKDLAEGRINIEQAKEELERRLFGQEFSNIDTGRVRRTGIPEVVLAEGKTGKQISDISQQFLDRTSRVIVSRLSEERSDDLISDLLECYDDLIVRYEPLPGFLVAHTDEMKVEATGGKVAILTAGTSDIPAAMEAELMAQEMGCETLSFYDIGIAGVHRVMGPLKHIMEWGADVLIVAAGREGALPTLVSGMIDIPVIGLPISTGYGIHGKGETALFAMLQSCSPIAVVNIDAGFVAGAIAGRIANRTAPSRE